MLMSGVDVPIGPARWQRNSRRGNKSIKDALWTVLAIRKYKLMGLGRHPRV